MDISVESARSPRSHPEAEVGSGGRHNCHNVHIGVLRNAEQLLGSAALADFLQQAGETRSLEALLDVTQWCSYEETTRLLEVLADALGGVEAFREAAFFFDRGSVAETSEDLLAVFQSLGGPAGILSEVAEAASKFSSVIAMEPGEVNTDWGVVTLHLAAGFAPHPLLCEVVGGILSWSSQVFGLPPALVNHERCVTRGGDECRFRVRWDTGQLDPAARALQWEQELAGVRSRFNALRSTVAELVSGHDVDTVLERIVVQASRAVRAPRYILAVRLEDNAPVRVHAIGFAAGEVDAVAAELLDDTAGPPSSSRLVVDIRSGRRSYGRLAAFGPDGAGFFDEERYTFAAYAELAAVALDSVTAMAEISRQGRTAQALLDLASAVADVTTKEEVASRLAAAVPRVVGSTVAGVMLWDGRRLVTAASHGLDGEAEVLFDRFAVHLDQTPRLRDAIERREPFFVATKDVAGEQLRHLLTAADTTATILLPIHIGEQLYGIVSAGVIADIDRFTTDRDLVARLRGLAAVAATAFRNAELLERLRHQSLHDPLTGTPNQRLLEDRTDVALAGSRRSRAPTALLFIDLDRFKNINDTLGHAAGDGILRQVVERLQRVVRQVDTVARLGGDEFAVLLPELAEAADAEAVARKLLAALQQPFRIGEQDLFINASVGIAVSPSDGACYTDLLKAADTAMYAAKAAGRGMHRTYTPSMSTKGTDGLGLEADLHRAVERDELRLVFQPQIDLRTMGIIGVEALVRWQHPHRGLLTPDEFIVLAEETGLVTDIDAWVLQQACEQLGAWRAAGWHNLAMAVNVSERDLRDPGFTDRVGRVLADTGIEANALELEITERVAGAAGGEMGAVLDGLHRIGIRIAIDDFGTGNSAFSRLLRGRIDTLKIDRSFLHELSAPGGDAPLVAAMITLGHSLGLVVVAEGVETAEQDKFVRQAGCDIAQGFYLSPPVESAELEKMLSRSWT